MLKALRRIETLERTFRVSNRFVPFVHVIRFVDGDGTVAGTMVMSNDPKLYVPYRPFKQEGER